MSNINSFDARQPTLPLFLPPLPKPNPGSLASIPNRSAPPPASSVTIKFGAAGLNPNNTSGDGLQVGSTVKFVIDPNTSLSTTVSASGYQGHLKNKAVEGTVLRATVDVNHNFPSGEPTKWNAGATLGVKVDQRRGTAEVTSVDVTAAGGFNRPLQTGKTKINLVGTASTKLNLSNTDQLIPAASLGVKLSDGPLTVTGSVSVEARLNLEGANRGKVTAVVPVIGLEASYKTSETVSLLGNLSYTVPTALPASSAEFFGSTSNPGWAAGVGVRIGL
jgi:hypothetical protein